MIKGDFKLWWFAERLHSSTNKNSHFLDLEKVISFVWYIQQLLQRSWVISNEWRISGAPLFDCLPSRTLGQDPPLLTPITFSSEPLSGKASLFRIMFVVLK